MTLPAYQYRVVTATIKSLTAFHIGSGKGERGTDSPIQRSNAGKIILPGSAIAGSLRSLATHLAVNITFPGKRQRCLAYEGGRQVCGCAVCHLFGEIHPSEKASEQEGGRASRVWIYDAPLLTSNAAFVRDGVGIDRASGAASRRVKFDLEVLPAGAIFELRLELEDADESDQALLAAVLAEWEAGRGWLGGDSSRGLGRLELSGIKCSFNPLNTPEQLIDYLKNQDPLASAVEVTGWRSNYLAKARANSLPYKPFIQLVFDLAFEGFFLTQDPTAAGMLGYDHVSLLDSAPGTAKTLAPILPGSGLRGVIRSHAERIARTLVSAQTGDRENFLKRCPACNPLENGGEGLTSCSKRLEKRRKVTEDQLCLACQLFGSSQRGSRLKIGDAALLGNATWKVIDFLAIDRFTGGGLEGAKFDTAALWKPVFRVNLHLEEPRPWEMGWLALVLRDICDGLLTFGFGSAKGFGQALAKNVTVRVGYLTPDDWGIIEDYEVKDAPGYFRLAEFTDSDWQKFASQVNGWLAELHQEIKTEKFLDVERHKDTYFGLVDELYPMKEGLND